MTMCPTYAFIDRADGRFNRAMDFKKDYSALVAAAWDIDTAYESYLMNPCEETYDVVQKMGLNIDDKGENDKASHEKYMAGVRKLMEMKPGGFRDRFFDPNDVV